MIDRESLFVRAEQLAIDKSALTLGSRGGLRDREHVRLVAQKALSRLRAVPVGSASPSLCTEPCYGAKGER